MNNPISYAQWASQQPNQSAINPQDYLASIGGNNNVNPGSLDDYTQANNLDGSNYAGNVQAYNDALAQYKSGQDVLSSVTPQKGQNYTADQIAQMTGSPVHNFNSYQGFKVATANNPFSDPNAQGWAAVNQFIQNPDGTYRVANLGGINPEIRVNAPESSDWTDYMNAAITAAVIAGNAYAGAGALGAAFAPAEVATLAGPTYGEMGYTGLNPGTFEGSGFTMPELDSAAPIGDQPGDYPMPGEDGTASQWKPSNINPQDVTNLLNYNASYANPGASLSDVLKLTNTAKQAIGAGSALSKLLSGGKSTSGTSSYNPGVSNTSGYNPGASGSSGSSGSGLTNLSASFGGGGKEATLVGLPSIQETSAPMSNNNIQQMPSAFASGGSTTIGEYNSIGDSSGGLQSLTPTFAHAVNKAVLLGTPHINAAPSTLSANMYSPSPVQSIAHMADGGSLPSPTYNYNQTGFPRSSPTFIHSKPATLYGSLRNSPIGDMSGRLITAPGHADGGEIEVDDNNPEFFSEGGMQNHYVQGSGTGTSDSVPARLADGEFVLSADVVSGLGDGSNKAGAKILDEFMKVIREHKNSKDGKLPSDSKGPLSYLLQAKKKTGGLA